MRYTKKKADSRCPQTSRSSHGRCDCFVSQSSPLIIAPYHGGECLEAASQILSLLVSRFQPTRPVDKIVFSANLVVGWKQCQASAALRRSASEECLAGRAPAQMCGLCAVRYVLLGAAVCFPATPSLPRTGEVLWLSTKASSSQCAPQLGKMQRWTRREIGRRKKKKAQPAN